MNGIALGSSLSRRPARAAARHWEVTASCRLSRSNVAGIVHGFGSRRELDGLSVRRAPRGLLPFPLAPRQRFRAREALGGRDALERGEPVPIILVAGVGLAALPDFADHGGKRLRPLGPRECAALVQRERQRKSLRLPRCAKYRAVGAPRQPGRGVDRLAWSAFHPSACPPGRIPSSPHGRRWPSYPRPRARWPRSAPNRATAVARRAPRAWASANTWAP